MVNSIAFGNGQSKMVTIFSRHIPSGKIHKGSEIVADQAASFAKKMEKKNAPYNYAFLPATATEADAKKVFDKKA